MVCMLSDLRDDGDQSDIRLSATTAVTERQQDAEHSTCATTLAAPAQKCNSCMGADQYD